MSSHLEIHLKEDSEVVSIHNVKKLELIGDLEDQLVVHSHQYDPKLNQWRCRDTIFFRENIKFMTLVTKNEESKDHLN